MTDEAIQAAIDACKAAGADPTRVEWDDLKTVLSNILTQTTLTDLSPSSGQVPQWNGSAWVTASVSGGGSSALSGLTDVSLASPASGEVLKWNGSAWHNAIDDTAGTSFSGTLDNVLAAGRTTNKNMVFDVDLVRPTVPEDAVAHNWLEFKPLIKTGDYADERVSFWFGQSSTLSSGHMNEVMMFGWNLNPNGGCVESGKPGLGESWESNYNVSGHRWVEKHEYYIKPSGEQLRLSSYTIDTVSGSIDFYITTGLFSIKSANVPDRVIWSLGDGSVGGEGAVSLDVVNKYYYGEKYVQEWDFLNKIYTIGYSGPSTNAKVEITAPVFATTGITTTISQLILNDKGYASEAWIYPVNDAEWALGKSGHGFNEIWVNGIVTKSKAGDPTSSDIPSGRWMLYKNSSSGALKLWANDGGTLKSVTLS